VLILLPNSEIVLDQLGNIKVLVGGIAIMLQRVPPTVLNLRELVSAVARGEFGFLRPQVF